MTLNWRRFPNGQINDLLYSGGDALLVLRVAIRKPKSVFAVRIHNFEPFVTEMRSILIDDESTITAPTCEAHCPRVVGVSPDQ
jgi:hypothetical protein